MNRGEVLCKSFVYCDLNHEKSLHCQIARKIYRKNFLLGSYNKPHIYGALITANLRRPQETDVLRHTPTVSRMHDFTNRSIQHWSTNLPTPEGWSSAPGFEPARHVVQALKDTYMKVPEKQCVQS